MNKKTKQLILRALQKNETLNRRYSDSELVSIVDEIADDVPHEKWWIIALKVLAYLIGLILAGVGTTVSAASLFPFINF